MSADLITIVIVPDPFQPELNRKHQAEHVPGATVAAYLDELITMEGVTLTGAIDGVVCSDILSAVPDPGAIVSVAADHEAGAIAAWVATAFTWNVAAGAAAYYIAYGVAYIAASYLITVGMSMLVSALGGRKSDGSPSSSETASPTYSFGQLRQTETEGLSIPLVFGTVRMAGQVLDKFTTVESDGKEYLHYLLAVNDGRVDAIANIQINKQSAAQFSGVTTDFRLGLLNQAIIEDFGEAVQQHAESVLLVAGVSTVRQTDGDQVEKIMINLVAPYGIYYSNSDGGIDARYADVLIEYKVDGGIWTTLKTERITGASTTAIRSQVVIDNLPAGRYSIRVTRTSADSSDFREQTTVQLVGYAEIVKQQQSFPGVALYAVKALASDQLSSEPAFTAEVSRSTVNVYNPYTSIWVSKPATNPAWACYDLMVGHHKIDPSKLIYDEFADWAAYCDELVDGQPRFTFSIVLDTPSDLWATVQRIAAIGRGRIMRRGAFRYGVFADKPCSVVSHVFTMATIRQDSYSRKFLPLKNRANAAEITYWDPDRDYTNQIASYRSSGWQTASEIDQPVKAQLNAFIPRAQALREACYAIECNERIRETVVFEAAWNSFTARVGDLTYFQHLVPDYGAAGGRVVSVGTDGETTTIALDRPVTLLPGTTYAILVQRSSDDSMIERVIAPVSISTTTDTVTLTEGFSSDPQPDDQWMLGPASTYKRPYRIIQTKRTNRLFATLTLLEYAGAIYPNADAYQGTAPVSDATVAQRAINAQGRERLSYGTGGDYLSVIDVTWTGATTVSGSTWSVYITDITERYQFQLRDGGSFISMDGTVFADSGIGAQTIHLGDTVGTTYTVPADKLVLGHRYRVTISPYNSGAADTGSNTADILIQGKLAPPADVASLTATWDAATRTVHLIWSEIADIDAAGYEIRTGNSWETGEYVNRVGRVDAYSASVLPEMASQAITYLIKAIDTSGIYSTNVASATAAIGTITGDQSTTVYLYAWSTAEPDAPDGTSTYNWSSGSHGAFSGTTWSIAIPINPGTPGMQLWRAEKTVIGWFGDTSATVDWSVGVTVASITANGATGLNTATPTVYQWAVTIPEGPTGSSTYIWPTGDFGGAPTGWTLTPETSPSAGYTLWAARVTLLDSAGVDTTVINWVTAAISAMGYAGTNGASGASSRVMYARMPGTLSPIGGTISVTGDGRPTQLQSKNTWGLDYAWSATDPNPSSTDSLYTSDGIYDPATGKTSWSTPYLASLKVGALSAITANLGTVNAGVLESSGFTAGGAGTYMDLNAGVFEVFDSSGVLRVKMGKLS